MAGNKMEQIASMFGKNLGEEFKVSDVIKYWARFTSIGYFVYIDGYGWMIDKDLFMELLTGEAEIVDDRE